jgi:ribosomal protein S18 acetylase RimI-like enzyme
MATNDFIIRKAAIKDIDFIVETIAEAEKSGSEINGFAAMFGLSDTSFRGYIRAILLEEIDGCELSTSSFVVVDIDGKAVAAIGGWIEGIDDIPSVILKSKLIGFTFPSENILSASRKTDILDGWQIEREKGTYQIEYVYVSPSYRGKNFAGKLLLKHIEIAKSASPNLIKMQVHVLENNTAAISVYNKVGFIVVQRHVGKNPDILRYMPHQVKLLMELKL